VPLDARRASPAIGAAAPRSAAAGQSRAHAAGGAEGRSQQGGCSLAALIAEPPACLASAEVAELLLALPGYGRVKVARLLGRCQVSPRKTVAGLSERQRETLIRALEK